MVFDTEEDIRTGHFFLGEILNTSAQKQKGLLGPLHTQTLQSWLGAHSIGLALVSTGDKPNRYSRVGAFMSEEEDLFTDAEKEIIEIT